jgi:hypothetical protein
MEDKKIKRVLIKFKELLQWRFFDQQDIFSQEINYFSRKGHDDGNRKESKNQCWYSYNREKTFNL